MLWRNIEEKMQLCNTDINRKFHDLVKNNICFITCHIKSRSKWIERKWIEHLNLSSEGITILPESIGSLRNLKQLYLSDNQLYTLPESIGSLRNLKQLYLSDNQLHTLPESIGSLTNLYILDLSHNQLQALPDSLLALPMPRVTSLVNNPLIDPDSWTSYQLKQEQLIKQYHEDHLYPQF